MPAVVAPDAVVVVLLLAGTGFVWIKFLLPLQQSADRNGPETAPRDYALQENNAFAVLDIASQSWLDIFPCGVKEYISTDRLTGPKRSRRTSDYFSVFVKSSCAIP